MSYYREQLNEWLSGLNVKAEALLDIGGGEGPIGPDKVRAWDVDTVKILDADDKYKPDYVHDLNKKMSWEDYKKHGIDCDVVFCLEVMEYIWNPVMAHINIYNLLNDDGMAYISYPTIYPLHNPPGIDYLRYSKNAIEKLLHEAGFSHWIIDPRVATKGRNHLANFYVLEGMRAMKHTDDIYDIGYLVTAFK